MKLIPEWKRAWRLWSVKLSAATIALAGLESLLPQLAAVLPPKWYAWAVLAIGIARLIKQKEAANA